ncbi:thiol-disulfide oxidoreductase DCC family protein [Tsuneonella rigui]|uniref:thiol-disulfide oxidoreductase DCC family protein n=1 Tax=Tsuneonella rigui TaxID=1708790 RepID=UPI000F7E1317|nr:DUF393 domain-containing protein [Tsuneonella rigui]
MLTVWWDGSCPLCRREVRLMRKLDRRGRIRFIDAASAPVAHCSVDRRKLLGRFHALQDGQMLSGAAAFAAVWRTIPVLRPLGLVARNPMILAALEKLYLTFLRIRPRLQRIATRMEQ